MKLSGTAATGHRTLDTDDPLARSALARALQSRQAWRSRYPLIFAQTVLIRRPSGSTSSSVPVSYLAETNPYRPGSQLREPSCSSRMAR